MKKVSTKVLSLLLSLVLIFGTVTVAFAADEPAAAAEPSLVTYGTKYFQTTSQAKNADIVLDALDKTLKENGTKEEIDLKLTKVTIDLTSVNGLCKTIDQLSLAIKLGGIVLVLLGDLSKLDFWGWKTGMKRGSQDITILNELIELVAENADVVAEFVGGDFDLGVLKDVINVNDLIGEGGVSEMLKQGIVQGVYPDTKSAQYNAALAKVKAEGIDAFIYEDMISDLVGKELLPGFTMNGSSKFDPLIKSVFKICWDNYLVKLISGINVDWSASDNEALKKLGAIMNLNGPTIDTNIPFDESKSFTEQINNIVGYMAVQFFPGYAGKWVNGDASKLGANLNNLYLYVAQELGIMDGIDKNDSSAVALAVFKFILANVQAEGMDEYIAGINSCKNLKEVAAVVLRNTAKINNIPVTSSATATYENILGDYLTYYAGKYVALSYKAGAGKNVWTVLNDVANVFLYDRGFAKAFNMSTTKDKDVFAKLDELIAKTEIFKGLTGDYSTKTFLKDGILEAVFSLDIAKIVDITVVRFMNDFGGKVVSEVIYDSIYNFLRNWMGKEILVARKTDKPIDNAISNSSLKTMVKNLLTQIEARKSALLPVILYLGAMLIIDIPATSVTVSNQLYTGDTAVPATATVVLEGKTYKLTLGQDYDIAIVKTTNDFNVGSEVTAKLSFYGDLKGEREVTYKVILDQVKNLKASSVTTNSAVLSWNAVPGAEKYEVVYNKKVVATTDKTTCKLTLNPATEYKYYVRAAAGSERGAYASTYILTNPAKASAPVVSATTDTAVKLTWKAVSGATGYVVEKYLGSNKWETVKVVNTTTYTVTGLKAKTSYYFRVKAYKKGTSGTVYGEPSAYIKTTTLIGTPKIAASASTYNAIKVTWSKVSGAAGYSLEQYNGKKWVLVKNTTATSYTFSKLKVNTEYSYRVRAYYKSGSKYVFGNYSTVKVSTAPTSSSKVVVSKPTSTTLTVAWKAVAGASGYRVYYSTNGKSWKYVNTTKTSVTLTKLASNQKYYVMVQAFKKTAGIYAYGPYSAKVTGTTNVAQVTGLKLSNPTKNSLTLKWNKVAGATGYTVYRLNGKKWVKVADVKTNSYTNKGLSRNTSYTYCVAAYKTVSKKAVYGDLSASAKAKTKLF